MDTLGLIWGVLVASGRASEAEGGKRLFRRGPDTPEAWSRWKVVWVDGGYADRIEDWVAEHCPFRIEVVKRTSGKKGWELLPKRWVVERTFAWLGRWRLLAKEYDYHPRTTEANILLAMTHRMLKLLTV